MSDPGFGVYVHWPFCASKCPYCDFNSHVRAGGVDEAGYLAAYVAEMAATGRLTGPRKTDSVFFGGGTPSLMAPATVDAMLRAIDRHWPIEAGAEITLEANPSSVEAGRFAGYKTAGVNRVSVGVQSLVAADLKALGRIHTVEAARVALGVAARTFERVSFDLIYARPHQTVAAWRVELAEALDMARGHLSLYQLTIEPETPFAALHAAGKLRIPDGDLAHDFYAATEDMTARAGLAAYEVSNYARPGDESRHNLLYWRYGEYAGIGPGAHGRVVIGNVRTATRTERSPERWRAAVEAGGSGLVERMGLSPSEEADEVLLMGLRLTEGLDLDRLAELDGVRPREAVIDELAGLGLVRLSADGRRLAATRDGRLVLNTLTYRIADALERMDLVGAGTS